MRAVSSLASGTVVTGGLVAGVVAGPGWTRVEGGEVGALVVGVVVGATEAPLVDVVPHPAPAAMMMMRTTRPTVPFISPCKEDLFRVGLEGGTERPGRSGVVGGGGGGSQVTAGTDWMLPPVVVCDPVVLFCQKQARIRLPVELSWS